MGHPAKRGRGRPRKNGESRLQQLSSRSTASSHSSASHYSPSTNKPDVSVDDSWGTIRRLSDLYLEEFYSLRMGKDNNIEAQEILDYRTLSEPVNDDSREDERLSGFGALIKCLETARAHRKSPLISRINYLFSMLMVGEIAVFLYGREPRVRNEEQQIYGQLSNWLEGQRRSATAPSPADQNDETLQLLKTMISRGRKLVPFCNMYGTGALFWLQLELSDHL